jgi:hypothetical protein
VNICGKNLDIVLWMQPEETAGMIAWLVVVVLGDHVQNEAT